MLLAGSTGLVQADETCTGPLVTPRSLIGAVMPSSRDSRISGYTRTVLRLLLLCAGATILAIPLQAASECSEAGMHQAWEAANNARAKLLDASVEGMDTSVPPAMQGQIAAMKDALARFMGQYMRCKASGTSDATVIQSDLAKYLDANKPRVNVPSDLGLGGKWRNIYGANLDISVKRPKAEPDWIAIEVQFDIMCGRDRMLLVYAQHEGEWQRVLRWQSGKYSEVSGAFGDFFQYLVISQPSAQAPLLVVAHGQPWCTSVWSGFEFDVIRVANNGLPAKVLLHRHESYNRGYAPKLRKTPKGFELRVRDMSVAFEQAYVEPVIYSFAIEGTEIRRIQPVAVNGRDFVDVWLRSTWAEALQWSESANALSLQAEHAKFEALQKSGSGTFSFGPVRGCAFDPSRFQVELDYDSDPGSYFQIREGQNSFTMLSASERSDPKCNGANIMKSR